MDLEVPGSRPGGGTIPANLFCVLQVSLTCIKFALTLYSGAVTTGTRMPLNSYIKRCRLALGKALALIVVFLMLAGPSHAHADYILEPDHAGAHHHDPLHEDQRNHDDKRDNDHNECLVCCLLSSHPSGALVTEEAAGVTKPFIRDWIGPVPEGWRSTQTILVQHARAPPYS